MDMVNQSEGVPPVMVERSPLPIKPENHPIEQAQKGDEAKKVELFGNNDQLRERINLLKERIAYRLDRASGKLFITSISKNQKVEDSPPQGQVTDIKEDTGNNRHGLLLNRLA